MSERVSSGVALGVLLAVLILVVGLALACGAALVLPSAWDGETAAAALVWVWRAPRVAAAAVVGACLALSGLLCQGVFRNPLAEPYLLGSAAGAGLGAAFVFLLPEALPPALGLPALAFIGALASSALVLAVGGLRGPPARLLLAGVALAAILSALRSLLLMLVGDESTNLRALVSWQLGGIQTPTWGEWWGLFLFALALLVATLRLAPGLDALGLGEEVAHSMGYRLRPLVFSTLSVAALATACAVAWGGLIGFVGLVVPHVARWWVGPLHARLAPVVALGGAVLMVGVDAVARSALAPSEIPVGLLTALLGGPFFLFLLLRGAR